MERAGRAPGGRRPSGWVLEKVRAGQGPARGVLHAPDCEEAPEGTPLLDVQRALGVAENPRTQLCTLCGCAQELTPLLSGFRAGGNVEHGEYQRHVLTAGPGRGGPLPHGYCVRERCRRRGQACPRGLSRAKRLVRFAGLPLPVTPSVPRCEHPSKQPSSPLPVQPAKSPPRAGKRCWPGRLPSPGPRRGRRLRPGARSRRRCRDAARGRTRPRPSTPTRSNRSRRPGPR
ncbi:DUF6233 domain-containing protein [Streptomyces diastaticus]|uniref:DUF6233 domain-containing protein n=1 Tax=Streptomyces diastaticus TaxID=1956 RepID=UPI003410BFBA